MKSLLPLLVFLFAFPSNAVVVQRVPGFGRNTTGGLGHATFTVDTLNGTAICSTPLTGTQFVNANPCIVGSLRYALEQPRSVCAPASNGYQGDDGCIIKFTGLTGEITLGGPIQIKWPNVTVDGRTASGQGIGITSRSLTVCASNIEIEYIRHRGGYSSNNGDKNIDVYAGCGVAGPPVENIYIHHCSMSWAGDTTSDVWAVSYDIPANSTRATNITLAYNIFAEDIGPGSSLIGGRIGNVTWFRNITMNNGNRNPHVAPGEMAPGVDLAGSSIVEMVQNVFYNFTYGTDCGPWSSTWNLVCEFLDNYYTQPTNYDILGPNYTGGKLPINVVLEAAGEQNTGRTRFYLSGNSAKWSGLNSGVVVTDQKALFSKRDNGLIPGCGTDYDGGDHADCFDTNTGLYANQPYQALTRTSTNVFPPAPVDGEALIKLLLVEAGVNQPCRDTEDISELGDLKYKRTNSTNNHVAGTAAGTWNVFVGGAPGAVQVGISGGTGTILPGDIVSFSEFPSVRYYVKAYSGGLMTVMNMQNYGGLVNTITGASTVNFIRSGNGSGYDRMMLYPYFTWIDAPDPSRNIVNWAGAAPPGLPNWSTACPKQSL